MIRNKKDLETYEKDLVWEFLKDIKDGFYVEVGANDPEFLSQTWSLEQKGWKGILIEPIPERAELLRKKRPNSFVFEVACSSPKNVGKSTFYIGKADQLSSLERYIDDPNTEYIKSIEVDVVTLDSILEKIKPSRIDFLSIDTEGTELDVLRGFSFQKWKPTLLLIEDKVHSLAKHFYIKKQGYKLVRRTGLNNWYIPEKLPPPKIMMWEKFYLLKKMYLGTPLRILKLNIKRIMSRLSF